MFDIIVNFIKKYDVSIVIVSALYISIILSIKIWKNRSFFYESKLLNDFFTSDTRVWTHRLVGTFLLVAFTFSFFVGADFTTADPVDRDSELNLFELRESIRKATGRDIGQNNPIYQSVQADIIEKYTQDPFIT